MTERQLLFAAGLMVAWSGFLVGILRALVAKMVRDMENRQAEQAKELAQIRREQQCCKSELAVNFQRREDSIREYTALNVKLDRLYELMARRNNE